MRNKKGFAILPGELLKLTIYVIFGIGLWLIYSGTKEFIQVSGFKSIIYGTLILLSILFFVQFKPAHFLIPK